MYSVKARRIVHCEHTVALTIETTCWGVRGAALKNLHDQFHAHSIKLKKQILLKFLLFTFSLLPVVFLQFTNNFNLPPNMKDKKHSLIFVTNVAL